MSSALMDRLWAVLRGEVMSFSSPKERARAAHYEAQRSQEPRQGRGRRVAAARQEPEEIEKLDMEF